MGDFATLLLLEDRQCVAVALRRCLAREGYRIVVAAEVEQAREALAGAAVDAILADAAIPGGGGVAFLGEARRRFPGAARILITGWPEALEPEDLVAAQPFAVFAKPWDAAELRATLRCACAPGRVESPAPRRVPPVAPPPPTSSRR